MPTIEDQPPPISQPTRTPAWELVQIDVFERYLKPMIDNGASSNDLAVVDLVLVDMRERDRIGRERYGVPLTAHNGRKHLVDAYQECLDMCVYLRAECDERGVTLTAYGHDGPQDGTSRSIVVAYMQALLIAISLRGMIP